MQTRFSKRDGIRSTIGIVMRGFRRPDFDIWLSATEAARENDLNVVTFTGHAIASPDESRKHANTIYELINSERLDGALVLASGVGLYVGIEGMSTFCQRLGDMPFVSAQMPVPGVPSVLIDNYRGMREVVDHLIEHHGYRRIAFIRGPLGHRGAHDRYRAYCDAMLDHGLPLDPDLVAPPVAGWDHQPGIPLFLDRFRSSTSVALDAVIGASANLAQQAQTCLQQWGIRVPEDVGLAGFDDFPFLWGVMPPMTTARAPFDELGRRAIDLLLAQIRGESVPMRVMLPARIVVRQSCGCPSLSVVRARTDSTARARVPVPGDLSGESPSGALSPQGLRQRRPTILASLMELVAAQGGGKLQDLVAWMPHLVDRFIDDFERLGAQPETASSDTTFLPALKEMLTDVARSDRDVTCFQDVLSVFQEHALAVLMPSLDRAPAMTARALVALGGLLSESRVMVNEITRNVALAARVQSGRQVVALSRVGHTLATVMDLKELADTLSEELPKIGIAGCYLALYEDAEVASGMARLHFAQTSRGRVDIPEQGYRFSARNLLPVEAVPALLSEEPYNILAEPLFVRDDQYGYLLLEVGPRDILFEDQPVEGTVYDILRGYVSDALCGISLYDEALRARQQAEEADRLKSRFLSMVSHELRTPLNVIVSLSEMLLWEQQTYQQELVRIHASAQHLDGLIRDVLDLASSQVGQLRLVREPLDLRDALEVVTVIGEQMARDKGLGWAAEVPERIPRVWGDRTRLRQVALNLISNAFRFTAQGEVCLRVGIDEDEITVSVSDTGIGVPLAEQELIFDEFRQSERTAARGYGGLGLGLAISRRLVEMHGGVIGVRSTGEEGEGATFYFTLPILEEGPYRVDLSSSETPVLSTAASPPVEPCDCEVEPERPVVMLTELAGAGEGLLAHLTERGYPVVELVIDDDRDPGDPLHWLNQLLQISPTALILDMKPALERGWVLMRMLKENPKTQNTPVLFYSLLQDRDGTAVDAEAEDTQATPDDIQVYAGSVLALDYLTKPVSMTDLMDVLDRQGIAASGLSRDGNEPEALGAELAVDAAPATFLVVDDDPDILAMHSWMLQSQLPMSRILRANNGRGAIDLMVQVHPDLVLLDLMMPELNGFDVIAEMQRDPDICDIPVVVLTAKTLTDDAIERLNLGVSSVLGKGLFSVEETFEHIESALRRTHRPNLDTRRLVRRAMAYIHEHYPEPISRKEIAAYVNVSPRHLDRCFSEELNVTPVVYLNRFRLRQARRLLDSRTLSISEVAAAVGYSDSSYFCRVFRKDTGMSPSDYQRHLS